MDVKKLVELRKDIKSKKPNYLRQNADTRGELKSNQKHIKVRVGQKYRKPRGCSSRSRVGMKGYPPTPTCGYRSPKAVRGTNDDGLMPIVASSTKDLEKLDSKANSVIVSGKLGTKKAIEVYSKAKELGFTIDNFDDSRVSQIKADFDKKVAEKKDIKKSREEAAKKESKKDTKKEKPSKKESVDEKDQKKEEKKAQEKIVTSKKTAM